MHQRGGTVNKEIAWEKEYEERKLQRGRAWKSFRWNCWRKSNSYAQ